MFFILKLRDVTFFQFDSIGLSSVLLAMSDFDIKAIIALYIHHNTTYTMCTEAEPLGDIDIIVISSIVLGERFPRAGSGVVRIDPFRFLARCLTRRLNQV